MLLVNKITIDIFYYILQNLYLIVGFLGNFII